MTVLFPISRGTEADQDVVPVAVPEAPVEVLHWTDMTPTLSLAVPLIEIVAEEADTIEEPGETICRVGGTVSVPDAAEVLVLGGAAVLELDPPPLELDPPPLLELDPPPPAAALELDPLPLAAVLELDPPPPAAALELDPLPLPAVPPAFAGGGLLAGGP